MLLGGAVEMVYLSWNAVNDTSQAIYDFAQGPHSIDWLSGWDDVIAVDFTRPAHSVQRTGADLQKWAKQQETKVDLSVLFKPRQLPMSPENAAELQEVK